jgi:hypothetical protein
MSRAVRDLGRAVGDGDQLGGVVGGDGISGHGTRGQDSGGDSETHFELYVRVERSC